FQVVGVALEPGSEVWHRRLDERQHQPREASFHHELGRAVVARPQFEGAHALEHWGEAPDPRHALVGDQPGHSRSEGAVRARNMYPQLSALTNLSLNSGDR